MGDGGKKFYTYKKLQGSQTFLVVFKFYIWFYTYKKLQGSQTAFASISKLLTFYTYKKLQGSQTVSYVFYNAYTVLHL